MKNLDRSIIIEHFEYISDIGRLKWKKPTSFRVKVGYLAGTVNKGDGYRQIRLGFFYKEHHLIWNLFKGDIPEDREIDHIDGNRLNNRFENLRLVTRRENLRNMCIPSHNTSGAIGVSKFKNKWQAYISIDNRKVHLGTFNTVGEAVIARKKADVFYGFSKTHGRPMVSHLR